IGSIIVVLAASGAALALEDDAGAVDRAVAPVSGALEISVGGGYLQGVGDIQGGGASVQDLAGAGAAGELKVGYRVSGGLAGGAYGDFARFARGGSVDGDAGVRSGSAGAYLDWHLRPDRSVDPWVGLSSGWRGLWVAPDAGKTSSFQGWEIARLSAGIDYAVTPAVAISPVIAGGLDVFFSADTPATRGVESIGGPRPSLFILGGVQGPVRVGRQQD